MKKYEYFILLLISSFLLFMSVFTQILVTFDFTDGDGSVSTIVIAISTFTALVAMAGVGFGLWRFIKSSVSN